MDTSNSIYLAAHFKHNSDRYFRIAGRLKCNQVEVKLETPVLLKGLLFHGVLKKITNDLYELVGALTNVETSKAYDVVSSIIFYNGILLSLDATISPKSISNVEKVIKFKLKREKYGISFEGESKRMNGSVKMNLINAFNWDVRAKTTQNNVKLFSFVTFMNVQVNGNATLYVQIDTPWQEMQKRVVDCNMLLNSGTGNLRIKHWLDRNLGQVLLYWRISYLSDMFVSFTSNYQINGTSIKHIDSVIFYTNPNKAFKNVAIGFDIILDKDKWKLGTNATISLHNYNNFDGVMKIVLPPPDQETHTLLLSFHANNEERVSSYVVGYSADLAESNYASDGSVSDIFLRIL